MCIVYSQCVFSVCFAQFYHGVFFVHAVESPQEAEVFFVHAVESPQEAVVWWELLDFPSHGLPQCMYWF